MCVSLLSYDNLFSSPSPQVLRFCHHLKTLLSGMKEQRIREGKKGSAAHETPSLIFKLTSNSVLHCMLTVNGAIKVLRWWRWITTVVFQFCRWMRIRQHDRPNDPGRIFSFSVCVYTSVCVCAVCIRLCAYLSQGLICACKHTVWRET